MNPEFRRQLWLQFSATRLIVLPLLVLACFAAVGLSQPNDLAQSLAVTGAVLFGLLVWGMGTLAAGASVIDEITEHTWDQQRMSALQPWAMTWGKLAGATSYGWYGGLICLLVAVPGALLMGRSDTVVRFAVVGVLGGVLLQALLIAVNLQLAKAGGRITRGGGVAALVLMLLWGVAPLISAFNNEQATWWGQTFGRLNFMVASLALFAGCALVAAWRSMAEVLAVRQWPWGWPALACVITAYLAGFSPEHRLAVFSVTGLMVSSVFTYAALLTEPQLRPMWQRVATRLGSSQWRAALQQLPRWPTTLALALPFALLAVFSMPPESGPPLRVLGSPVGFLSMTLVMLMARDCALALFLAFSPTGRRPVRGFLVWMLVLYGLLPWLVGSLGSTLLLGLVQPLTLGGVLSLAFAALHLVLALGLLRWRWQATAPA